MLQYLLVVPAAAAAGSTCGNHLPLVPAEKHLSPLVDAAGADGTSGHRLLVVPTTVPQVVRAILPCLLPPSLPPLPTQCQHGANTVPTRCQHGSCKTHIWNMPAGAMSIWLESAPSSNTVPTRSQHGANTESGSKTWSSWRRRAVGDGCWWHQRWWSLVARVAFVGGTGGSGGTGISRR